MTGDERRQGNHEILAELRIIGGKVDNVIERVAANEKTISQLIGGVKAGRWIIGTLIAVAGLFGLSEFSK